MSKKKIDHNLIAALDIGTTKVVALIGEIKPDGEIEAIGMGSHPSHGLKRGMVVNIEATVESIKRALQEAELMAGCQVHSVHTGIAGSHIRSHNSQGIVAIKTNEVDQNDIDRVIDAAKAVAIPADQKILHILPQEYIIDSQEGIKEPIGMSGVRLEAKVHLVTGSVSAIQNIVKCVERCNIRVANVILQQLASSQAVLTDDEKELGVCLVDIGGGTTDIAVFTDGAIRYSAVIPIAGDQVTNDLAVAFRTPTKFAEEIKVKHASALRNLAGLDQTISVPSTAQYQAREISTKALAEVVEARYEELFNLILLELKRHGFQDRAAAGVVLTGGAAKITGILPLAEQILRMPVRLGIPSGINGLNQTLNNPIYATSVGLLLHALQEHEAGTIVSSGSISTMLGKTRGWFKDNF